MKTLVRALFFVFVSHTSYTQTPHFIRHALPSDYKTADVTTILQSRSGFVWVGTTQGLLQYNGNSYKVFRSQTDSIEHITSLFEDDEGAIWVGYNSGKISRLWKGKYQFLKDSLLATVPITGFELDEKKSLWVSTYGEGLVVLADGKITRIRQAQGLSDDFIYCLATDDKQNVIAGSDGGISICVLQNETVTVKNLSSNDGLPDNIVTTLTVHDGRIFAGTESSGIAVLDKDYRVQNVIPGNIRISRVTSIVHSGSTIFIATSNQGIVTVDSTGHMLHFLRDLEPDLPQRVNDLMKDTEGNVWAVSSGGSLFSANPIFTFFQGSGKNQPENVQSILYTRDNRLWYSTDKGVYVLSAPGTNVSADALKFPELTGVQIISLFEDERGLIWMGTFDHGVFVHDPRSRTLQKIDETHGLINNNVLSIGGVGKDIWFATLGGVSRGVLRENSAGNIRLDFDSEASRSGPGSNYVYKILVDSRKRIWFATDGQGVSLYENGAFRNFVISEVQKSNIVYSLTEDASGGIWASTANAGIFRFNGDSFQVFTPENQIRDYSITSIIGEKNGYILLVSKQGIDVLDLRSKIIFYHGLESGIENIDPNLNAFTYDMEKNIWIGTQNGIVKYNTNIPPLRKWPITKINEVQVFLSPVDTADNKLNHSQNHISFDYIGLWFHDPSEVSYKVKLQGYDREWTNSKNNFITYPNLPPGKYTFMVRSSATNNFTGAPMSKYSFEIRPPFYNTMLFYAACTFTFFALLFWVVNTREKRLRAAQVQEREKIQFQLETLKNQVNPHFLFNSFNTLIGVIEEDRDVAVQYVEKLSDFYRDILVNREKDVIPLAKELDMIRNYYFLQLKRYKENLRININVDPSLHGKAVPPLTLQLLVENAIKHNIISTEKPLVIDIDTASGALRVRNNLQRKIAYEASTGLGLENIRSRYRLLSEKEIIIEETSESFAVTVPLLDV